MATAVFDFDRTLTREDTVRGFYRIASRSWSDWQPPVAPLRVGRTLGRARLFRELAIMRAGFCRFLAGRSKDDLEQLGRDYVRTVPLHGGVVERLDRHLGSGSRVFIVSASWDVYARAFRPGPSTIATGIEYADGVAER